MPLLPFIVDVGLISARPAAGIEGRLYFATDEGIAYYDNGSVWLLFQVKNNLVAVAAPLATDDSTQGYTVGSFWFYNGTLYVATDVSVGTAVWDVAGISTVDWTDITNVPASFTPTAHASTHQSGGTDTIKLDDLVAPDDNTDLNATTLRHGLLPKLSGNATDVLLGTGAFGASPGVGSDDIETYLNAILTDDDGNVLTDDDGNVLWELP